MREYILRLYRAPTAHTEQLLKHEFAFHAEDDAGAKRHAESKYRELIEEANDAILFEHKRHVWRKGA